MGRLLAFLVAYANAFFFVLLQVAAITILVNYNRKHEALVQSMLQGVTGRVEAVYADYRSYFNLRPENEKLQQENIELRKRLIENETRLNAMRNRVPLSAQFTTLPDSLLPLNRFRFIACRAIGNTTTGSYNYITLNSGRRHGVQKGMGLLSAQGAAGIVVSVSEHYAVAMSLLNKDVRLSAKVRSQDIFGTFQWDGGSAYKGKLLYVPLHFKIAPGDTVVTSAYSTVFPENITLGVVETVTADELGGFHDITLRLNTDFHALDYLYLVQHYYKPEIDSLTKAYQPR
jgi:rod shape-determining protein MreC